MSLAALSVDFYDDDKHEVMTKLAMPRAVATAHTALLTPEQREELPDHAYGLIMLTKRASVLRKFPVNDPGNTWLSAQYFSQNHEKLAFPARFVAATFIKRACDAYGVPSSPMVDGYAARANEADVQTNVFVEGSEQKWMLQKLAQRELMTKQADAAEFDALSDAPDEHYALVMRMPDGSITRKYAMPDASHVKTAARYFDKYAMAFPPEHRHNFAMAVANRAEELEVDVSGNPLLMKWAGSDWNRNIYAHFEQRRSLLPRDEQAQEVLSKLANALADSTPSDVAEALSEFDKATGLTRYYDRALEDPYASVTTTKVAEAWSEEVDGHIITEADLRKEATLKKIGGYLGETFARQFGENPSQIFESLPVTEKQLIKQVVAGEV